MGVHMFMCLKEVLAWATGKQHWVISIINTVQLRCNFKLASSVLSSVSI